VPGIGHDADEPAGGDNVASLFERDSSGVSRCANLARGSGEVAEVKGDDAGRMPWDDPVRPGGKVLMAFMNEEDLSDLLRVAKACGGAGEGFGLNVEGEHEAMGADSAGKFAGLVSVAGRSVDDKIAGFEKPTPEIIADFGEGR
jgi:hypothetical protein